MIILSMKDLKQLLHELMLNLVWCQDFDGMECRIFNRSQTYKCARCSIKGKKINDQISCPAFIDKQDIIAFWENINVFSNMHSCSNKYKGVEFASAEHCYQYAKCKTLILIVEADQILQAPSAEKAKQIANAAVISMMQTLKLGKPAVWNLWQIFFWRRLQVIQASEILSSEKSIFILGGPVYHQCRFSMQNQISLRVKID